MTQPAAETRGEISRAHIIEVTSRILKTHGFDAVSIRKIALESGTTIGGIYFHFSSKEDLLIAVLRSNAERIMSAVREAVESAPPGVGPRERLRIAIQAQIETLLRHGEFPVTSRVVLAHLSAGSRKLQRKGQDAYTLYWRGLLEDAQAAGLLGQEVDLTLVTFFIFGAINWSPEWIDPKRRSPALLAEDMCAMILRGPAAHAAKPARRT